MKCPNCQQENGDGVIFCASCGMRLEDSGELMRKREEEEQRRIEEQRQQEEQLLREKEKQHETMIREERKRRQQEEQRRREEEQRQQEMQAELHSVKRKGKRWRNILLVYGILVSFAASVWAGMWVQEKNRYESLDSNFDELYWKYNELEEKSQKAGTFGEFLPEVIVDITDIYNADGEQNVIGEIPAGLFGIYEEDVKYLTFDCDVHAISPDITGSFEVGVDIVIPSGSVILKGEDSDHTFVTEVEDEGSYSLGWGSDTAGYYGSGTYTIIVYYGDKVVGCKSIILSERF